MGIRLLRLALVMIAFMPVSAAAAEKFVTIHSSRVMSQSMPWIAQEAGLFKKYNIDHQLVFIASSSIVTAALLGGDSDMTITGGIGNVIAYVRGIHRRGVHRQRQKHHDPNDRGQR